MFYQTRYCSIDQENKPESLHGKIINVRWVAIKQTEEKRLENRFSESSDSQRRKQDEAHERVNTNLFQSTLIIKFSLSDRRMLQHGIRHLLYPTSWFSSLPFYTALQVQQSYSYANDVVLLASSANSPISGQGGSGIYVGRSGAIAMILPSEATQ